MEKNINMKKVILLLTIIISINLNAQIAQDKQKHLIAGGLIGSSVTYFTLENSNDFGKSFLHAMAFTAGAGIGKECWDVFFYKSNFDLDDLGATMIGGFVGSVVAGVLAWDEERPFRYRMIIRNNRQSKQIGLVINF